MRVFIFGLGYCGIRIAKHFSEHVTSIAGTCRSPERADELPIETHVFDAPTTPLRDIEPRLKDVTHLLTTIGPLDDGSDPVLASHRDALLAAPNLQWIGYLSATSVYGNADGAWVDESSPLRPSGNRGRRRVAVEQKWIELGVEKNVPVHVFRLGSIYGEGRSFLDSVESGRTKNRISKPGHVFNRIHVDDIVSVVIASMNNPSKSNPAVYNVVDEVPMSSQEVLEHVCKLLGKDDLPLIDWEDDNVAWMKAWYMDNRRVSNEKVKRELGVELKYPTVIEGLTALSKQKT